MKVNLPITVFVVFAVFCFAVNDVRAHMHNMMKYASVMSPNGKFQLQWAYNNDTGMLYFKMKCQGTGWCGVGFAVNGDGRMMASYDVAIGGHNGTAGYLWDYWSAGAGKPTLDATQNLTLMGANEMNGSTLVDFMRPANSMDALDVAIMSDTEVWVMYGSGPADATDATMFDKHADDAREVLPMKYNLIAMAMAAAAEPAATSMHMPSSVSATVSTMADSMAPTTASATKCGGSHAFVAVILFLIARFVFSS